jgi:hypothetical protein
MNKKLSYDCRLLNLRFKNFQDMRKEQYFACKYFNNRLKSNYLKENNNVGLSR